MPTNFSASYPQGVRAPPLRTTDLETVLTASPDWWLLHGLTQQTRYNRTYRA